MAGVVAPELDSLVFQDLVVVHKLDFVDATIQILPKKRFQACGYSFSDVDTDIDVLWVLKLILILITHIDSAV